MSFLIRGATESRAISGPAKSDDSADTRTSAGQIPKSIVALFVLPGHQLSSLFTCVFDIRNKKATAFLIAGRKRSPSDRVDKCRTVDPALGRLLSSVSGQQRIDGPASNRGVPVYYRLSKKSQNRGN